VNTRTNGDRRRHQTPLDELAAGRREPAAEAEIPKSADPEEPLAFANQEAVLLPPEVEIVDAVCLSIERQYFKPFKHPSLAFRFAIAVPEQFCELDLWMYTRETKSASIGSKLYAAAVVANNGRLLQKRQAITRKMFLHRMFRCKVRRAVSRSGKAYSVIDSLMEALTGPS